MEKLSLELSFTAVKLLSSLDIFNVSLALHESMFSLSILSQLLHSVPGVVDSLLLSSTSSLKGNILKSCKKKRRIKFNFQKNNQINTTCQDGNLSHLPSVSKFGNWGHSKTISKYNETCLKQTLNITASCLNRTTNIKFQCRKSVLI